MIATPVHLTRLQAAMQDIAAKKGEFSLFALVKRSEAPHWDLLVAAPWLEEGRLRALSDFVNLLNDFLGETTVRNFAKIVTLKGDAPDIRSELAKLNVSDAEKRLYDTVLFGAQIDEAIILRAKPSSRRRAQKTKRPHAAPGKLKG